MATSRIRYDRDFQAEGSKQWGGMAAFNSFSVNGSSGAHFDTFSSKQGFRCLVEAIGIVKENKYKETMIEI